MSAHLIASYSETNYDSVVLISGNALNDQEAGQSFTGLAAVLTSAKFYIYKVGTPTGSLYARIFGHTGTYGVNGIPTNSIFAQSDPIDVATLGTSPSLVEFTFSGASRVTLTNGTHYFIVISSLSAGDASNGTAVGVDSSSPSASGNGVLYRPSGGGWIADNTIDYVFYVYGVIASTVTTQSASSIAGTTATANGNITDTGGENNDKRGIVYDTVSRSTPGNVAPGSSGYTLNISESGSFASGAFTESMTSLALNTTYYVRAWSHNSKGYTYGTEISFTTLGAPTVTTQAVSSISYTTATGNGNVTSIGGESADHRGVVYGTATHGDPGNTAPASTSYGSFVDESGTFSTGAFTESVVSLSPNTTYYVRAYGHNSAGYSYGSEVSFTTSANTYPTETTQAVSSITGTTATANGNITDTGNQTPDIRGFVYDTSTHTDPGHTAPASSAYASNISASGSFTTGAFTGSLSGLSIGTTYYVRSFAHNASGYTYGSEVSFTTQAAPTVTTQAVTNNTATLTTATGNGNVTSGGDTTVTERGTVINTTGTPTTSDTKFTTTGTTGAFTTSMTGLIPGQLYYLRAYAINSIGTSYGSQVTFTAVNWLNPTNVYTDDGTFCTAGGDSGVINIQLSGDGGTTWSNTLSKTFNGTNGALTYGNGSTELWGLGWVGSNVSDTNFRVRVSNGTRADTHMWETFGFAPGSTVVLTGIEVIVKAKWVTPTTSIDNIKIKIYYGSSVLPIQAGSQQYATDASTTGALEVYNGSAWKEVVDTSSAQTITGKSIVASQINSGTLPVAQLPAFTGGDVTSSAGSASLAIGSLKVTTGMLAANAATLAKLDASNATANKVLMSGASASPTWSTPTFPNASATSRKIIASDGTNWVASTETWPVPGTSANVLKSDGTNWTSVTAAAAMPALTGDVTTSAGSAATSIGAGKVTQAMLDTAAGGIGAAWQTFTPSLSNWTIGTGGSAGTTAKYVQIGKVVIVRLKSTLGSSGQSVSGEPTFNLPVTASANYANLDPTNICWMKSAGTGQMGYIRLTSTTTAKLVVMSANATYVGDGTISSTVPGNWAAGDLFTTTFLYEAA